MIVVINTDLLNLISNISYYCFWLIKRCISYNFNKKTFECGCFLAYNKVKANFQEHYICSLNILWVSPMNLSLTPFDNNLELGTNCYIFCPYILDKHVIGKEGNQGSNNKRCDEVWCVFLNRSFLTSPLCRLCSEIERQTDCFLLWSFLWFSNYHIVRFLCCTNLPNSECIELVYYYLQVSLMLSFAM